MLYDRIQVVYHVRLGSDQTCKGNSHEGWAFPRESSFPLRQNQQYMYMSMKQRRPHANSQETVLPGRGTKERFSAMTVLLSSHWDMHRYIHNNWVRRNIGYEKSLQLLTWRKDRHNPGSKHTIKHRVTNNKTSPLAWPGGRCPEAQHWGGRGRSLSEASPGQSEAGVAEKKKRYTQIVTLLFWGDSSFQNKSMKKLQTETQINSVVSLKNNT